MKKIKYEINSFIQGIKNLIKYRSLVWQDRWYDHSFFIKMIEFKLKDMAYNWKDAHYVGSDFTKKRIVVMQRRIQRFELEMEDLLYEYIVKKTHTKEEYLKLKNKIINNAWCDLGRNIHRFWD